MNFFLVVSLYFVNSHSSNHPGAGASNLSLSCTDMKKFILLLALVISLASCGSGNTQSNESEGSEKIDTLNIENFAFNFYRTHDNIANNSITRKEAAKEFQNQFKEAVNNNELLKGVPMNLRTLKEQKNGKYIAHFWSTSIDRNLIKPFENINFDFAVTLPKEVAVNLVEKSNYLLDVTYIGHIDNIEDFQLLVGYNDWVQTGSFELKPNEKRYDETQTFDIDLGMMIVDFKDITPYSRQ